MRNYPLVILNKVQKVMLQWMSWSCSTEHFQYGVTVGVEPEIKGGIESMELKKIYININETALIRPTQLILASNSPRYRSKTKTKTLIWWLPYEFRSICWIFWRNTKSNLESNLKSGAILQLGHNINTNCEISLNWKQITNECCVLK